MLFSVKEKVEIFNRLQDLYEFNDGHKVCLENVYTVAEKYKNKLELLEDLIRDLNISVNNVPPIRNKK
jgi:hypothetical protein